MNSPMATLGYGVAQCRHGAINSRVEKIQFYVFSKNFSKIFFSKNHHFFSVNTWDMNFIPLLRRVSKLSNDGSYKPVSAIVQEI